MKKIVLMGCIAFVFTANAQVTLQPGIAAAGLVQKNQLWNILAVNAGTAAYDCRLRLVLTDRTTGQEIFTASTAQFSLPKGARQLNVNTLTPIQYNYLSGTAGNSLQTLLPAGMYNACYSINSIAPKEETLAEECVQFDAEPLSPPMLVFPSDSSVLDVAPVQFSWTPPLPAEMFSRLHYEVLITEINEGQKADDAIQQNIPFYSEGSVISNTLNYPGSAGNFEKNKWYAWQVVARDDNSYAGKSEVWVFTITDKAKVNVEKEAYAEVKSFYTGKKYYFTSVVNFSFNNSYTARPLDYSIRNIATNEKLERLPVIRMTEGLNHISIEARQIKGLQRNVQYVLEIYNLGSGIQYLSFIVKD